VGSDSGARYSSSPLGGGAHWDALAARYSSLPGLKPVEREPPAAGFYSTSPSRQVYKWLDAVADLSILDRVS
jgi:hypothetical protein